LRSNSERVLNAFNLVLGIIAVCSSRSSENGCQQWARVAQSLPNASWEGNYFSTLAISFEEVLDIWSNGVWSWYENNIMLF